MAPYASDAVAYDLIGPLAHVGADGVRSRAREWFESFEGSLDFELRDVAIVAADGVAFSHFLTGVRGTKKDGEEIGMWWRSTIGCRRVEDEWRIVHSHDSVPFDMETGQAILEETP